MAEIRREIGSEFWDVPAGAAKNGLFPENTGWFLSGRSALKAIVRELKGCRTVDMPSWCCDSMVEPFRAAGMEVRFYPVYFRDGLVRELPEGGDVLFVMDYFGSAAEAPVRRGGARVVIRDTTHSVFSASFGDADYSFGSLRKWCGVWTGGYAVAEDGRSLQPEAPADGEYVSLRRTAMEKKASYIGSREDGGAPPPESKSEYLQLFGAAEKRLELTGIAAAAERDVRLIRQLDVRFMKERRRANAEVLRDALPDWLIIPELKGADCPMFVPVRVPDGQRDALREYLIRREIYCPVHWPGGASLPIGGRERALYDSELSLVCDQRYSAEDMLRIAEAIRAFRKGR